MGGARGGIGRRARLRLWFRKAWRFKSSRPHHFINAVKKMSSPISHPYDPLHGITLEKILNDLVQKHGWLEMGRQIPIRCFKFNPTVKSSLTFLRKTPWARKK